MFTLWTNKDMKTIQSEPSDNIIDLIGQLVIAVVSNKDYPFGAITRKDQDGFTLVVCKASPSKGLIWYDINGIAIEDCPDFY